MNPASWQTTANPFELLDLLTGKINRRKAIALMSSLQFGDWTMRQLTEASEAEPVAPLLRLLLEQQNENEFKDEGYTWGVSPERRAVMIAGHLRWQADVIREVVPPPHLALDNATGWRSPAVIHLARTMYEFSPETNEEYEAWFQAMPVLGDALEEAGCHLAEVLDHCRREGEHRRACWVLDLILEPA